MYLDTNKYIRTEISYPEYLKASVMLEIFKYCHLRQCSVKFSFEIPMQVFIKVAHQEFESISVTQGLPWDHIYEEKVFDVVKFCTEKILEKIKQLDIPVCSLKFSVRTDNILDKHKIKTVNELIQYTEKDLLGLPHFGNTCLLEVNIALSNIGCKLADS